MEEPETVMTTVHCYEIDLLIEHFTDDQLAAAFRPEAANLLRGAAKNIDAFPEEWDQSWWQDGPVRSLQEVTPGCGTQFCTAGWILAEAGYLVGGLFAFPDTPENRRRMAKEDLRDLRVTDETSSIAQGLMLNAGVPDRILWHLFGPQSHCYGKGELTSVGWDWWEGGDRPPLDAYEWADRLMRLAARLDGVTG